MNPILAKLTLDNADPAWFWLTVVVVSVGILLATYRGIYQRSGRRLTWLLLALRLLGVVALLISLIKPSWTTIFEKTERPRVAVVLDDSQSMSILHHPAGADQWSPRYTQALAWLNGSAAGRLLREKFDVSIFNVAGEELDIRHLPSEPTAEQTDLVRGLRAAAGRLRGQQAPGVILISDGRDTTGRESYLAAQELPLPVFTVGFKQSAPGKGSPYDLAVVSVDAPQRTLVHNTVQVKVLVSKDGGDAVDLPVQITRAGTPLMSQQVALPAGAIQQMVTLLLTPTEPGDFVLTARIPEQPNERTGVNNVRMFKLRVDAEPIRVLYLEGYLRPEYTFLRDRLGNDPDVDLATFVRSANPELAGASGVMVGTELITAERLKKIDVVLLGDFEARMLDEQTYRLLKEWVENGGALMVLGGYHNLTEGGLTDTPLAEALPVELMTGPLAQIEEPFAFKLTEEGKRHPAMVLTGDTVRDASLWESLPMLKGIVAVRSAKPGATVLARHPAVPPDSPDRQGFIVLAWQRFGKGPVAVLTADTTWRWSRIPRLTGKPDTLYVRFWSQMIRWLAGREIDKDITALTVTTDAAVYDRGQRVTVRVNRNPAAMVPGQEGAATSLLVSVRTPDGRTAPLTPAQSADPNAWTATYFPDRGGRFEVDGRLVVPAAGGQRDVANQTAEFLVHGSSLELDDPSTNPAALAQLSHLTGGVYADIDDQDGLNRLVQSLPSEERVIYETRKATVWNNPALFVLFLACVTAEWIVRRRNQLV